jgi:hypothetical protein
MDMPSALVVNVGVILEVSTVPAVSMSLPSLSIWWLHVTHQLHLKEMKSVLFGNCRYCLETSFIIFFCLLLAAADIPTLLLFSKYCSLSL